MKSKKKSSQPTMPTAQQLQPMIDLQAKYSRVGVETPFGAQNYRTNPDGTSTLVTSLSPQGQGLVNRSMQLGMTDSDQVYVPEQVNGIASALANRVGGRFGMDPQQGGVRLGPSKPMAPMQSMPGPNLPQTGGNGQMIPGG